MIELAELVEPAHSAVVTMEMQRGVVGDHASIPALAEAAQAAELIATVNRLCEHARRVGATVVHCTVSWRADRRGTALNTPLTARLARNPDQILAGSDHSRLVPELVGHPDDLRSERHHGLTPFVGTDLDVLLRNCGIRTVIAAGASLNVGVLGLCLNAADLGYRVVVPTDAVVGTPARYGEEVLHHTIGAVATLTATDAIIAAWATPPSRRAIP